MKNIVTYSKLNRRRCYDDHETGEEMFFDAHTRVEE